LLADSRGDVDVDWPLHITEAWEVQAAGAGRQAGDREGDTKLFSLPPKRWK